jgi:N-methylhydantoinase B/oxoprolinase/acetone carboxylase alpha subunit
MSNESQVVQALLLARYTLVIHNRMKITSEGESWTLDFDGELAKIDAALQSVGIDTTQAMVAPVQWGK